MHAHRRQRHGRDEAAGARRSGCVWRAQAVVAGAARRRQSGRIDGGNRRAGPTGRSAREGSHLGVRAVLHAARLHRPHGGLRRRCDSGGARGSRTSCAGAGTGRHRQDSISGEDAGARASRFDAADGVLRAHRGGEAVKIDRGSSLYVFLATIVAATSGLLFGFDIAVINGALIFLRAQLHLSEVQTEMAASSLLFGCIFGASVAGWLSDRFGRRRVLMISGLLFAVSAIGAAIPRTLGQFAAARLAGGLAVGAASVLAPLYIAEVAPAKSRGRLVAFNAQNGWRWMFAAAAVPAVAFFIALFFVPESPRWLVENDRSPEALRVLRSE